MNKLFLSQVAEQTIYFPKFAEQSFFYQKTIDSPPPGIKWSAPNPSVLVLNINSFIPVSEPRLSLPQVY